MGTLARAVTPDEIASYNHNGVVLLRGILELQSVNSLRRAIDAAVSTMADSPSGYDISLVRRAAQREDRNALRETEGGQHDVSGIMAHIKASGKSFLLDQIERGNGSFLLDTGVAFRIGEFRKFALNGPGPEIAGALLQSETVRFYNDQIFVKEARTPDRTAFHQDATYFEIDGDQCCVLWIPVDPVSLESGAMIYLRGSHRDGRLYRPNVFMAQTPLPGSQGEPLPDIEGHMDDYDLIYFETEPGDVLVHHYRTIHGAGGNTTRYQVRRAASLRYCGDDIRFRSRPWAPKQLHHTHHLNDDNPLSGPDFPTVWERHKEDELA
jgi:ectoine hydroxylase-related dioxygenase (phytanoyl-CoA dioxygenase family)